MTAQEPQVAAPRGERLARNAAGVLTILTLALAALVFLFGPAPVFVVAMVLLASSWIGWALGCAAAHLSI